MIRLFFVAPVIGLNDPDGAHCNECKFLKNKGCILFQQQLKTVIVPNEKGINRAITIRCDDCLEAEDAETLETTIKKAIQQYRDLSHMVDEARRAG